MKYLFLFLFLFSLVSCATSPKGFSKTFNLETGKELKSVHPFHSGKSDCKIINQSNFPKNIITGDIDTIIWSNSDMTIQVNALDSLIVDDVLIDNQLLGKQKYKWVFTD